MRTSVKIALAGSLGGVLLVGGAGSLAYWQENGTASGSAIGAGTLTLGPPNCGSGWTVNGTAPFVPATAKLVPGDTLVKVCSFAIAATGQNLHADITTVGGQDSGALGDKVTTTAAYTVDGETRSTVTDADNGKSLKATITLAFPYGTLDNTSRGLTGAVSDYVVTLTQADPTLEPAPAG